MLSLRELRDSTHMTQREFAAKFAIPLATYRKWEQGEATPAPYVVRLIASSLPAVKQNMDIINGVDSKRYYYDKCTGVIYDDSGTEIHITCDLDGVKPENLQIYLERLFSDYKGIIDKFEQDCQFDKKENIIWKKL